MGRMQRVDIKNPPKAAEPIFGRKEITKVSDKRMVNRSLNLVAGSKHDTYRGATEFYSPSKGHKSADDELVLDAPEAAGHLDRDFLESAIATYNRLAEHARDKKRYDEGLKHLQR